MKKTFIVLLVFTTLVACNKPKGYGDLTLNIGYSINDKALITDTLCYTNEAGNTFMITEIQWFLSDMELIDENGDWHSLQHRNVSTLFPIPQDGIFYIDTNIPESQAIQMASLPCGRYTSLRFTFGLDAEDNRSGLFSDPPEANMFWPEPLGGGYHYMKLNGRYLDENKQLAPLNIHLGIGQNEDQTEFYQNCFTVELPIDFTITENTENQLFLTMIIDNWFRNPNLYDFNEWGNAIMQNQAAQQALKENGNDVFRIGQNTENQNNIAMKKDEYFWEKFNNAMQKAAPKPRFWSWKNVKERIGSPVGTTANRQAVSTPANAKHQG